MSQEKYDLLVERLLARTRNGELVWQKTAGDNTYQVSFPEATIVIKPPFSNAFGSHGHVLELVGSMENVLESVDGGRRSLQSPGKFNERLTALYNLVKRQTLGVDRTLDKLLETLDR